MTNVDGTGSVIIDNEEEGRLFGLHWIIGSDNQDQVNIVAGPSQFNAVPEPLTILGTGVVLGAIPVLKKEYAKRNKKKDEST